jgi:CheY-like chemotaxis protein
MTLPASWPDLVEAACLLRDAIKRLGDALGSDAPERFLTAVTQMTARARSFANEIEHPSKLDLRDRTVRHDLRGHLALIIGYGELWQKRKNQASIGRYLDDLNVLVTTARHALELLDGIVAQIAVALPVPQPPPAPATSPLLTHRQPIEQGRLLVVDDNRDNRDLLQALLEQQGHTVVVAASGQEALELLAQQSFDLVLLDVMMPEMDGFAVLERLKADPVWRHIPVLMVSALDRLDSVVAGIARGAEDYLTRPFDELLLRTRIGACLEKKLLRDREIQHLEQIDRLLHAIFPHEVVDELTQNGQIQPRRSDKVGVCFVDVVGFTSFCDRHAERPEDVVGMLEWYVEAFEAVARQHGAQKIKTIGDAFLMVSGLLKPVENPVLQLLRCAVALLDKVCEGPAGWQVRVGIHVGPVVAGTLGESQYSYDLWGSTVNIAARLESLGRPGVITLSEEAWHDVAGLCRGVARDVAVRGIGPMTAWEFVAFTDEESAATLDKTTLAAISGAAGAAEPTGRD